MRYGILAATIITMVFIAGLVQAGEVVVIVNASSSITDATADDVSKVFRGKASNISGTDVVAVDQNPESQARIDFSEKILGRSVSKMEVYWKKQVFAGKGEPPTTVEADSEMIEFVKKNANAIGYITAGSLTDDVKTVTVDGKVKW